MNIIKQVVQKDKANELIWQQLCNDLKKDNKRLQEELATTQKQKNLLDAELELLRHIKETLEARDAQIRQLSEGAEQLKQKNIRTVEQQHQQKLRFQEQVGELEAAYNEIRGQLQSAQEQKKQTQKKVDDLEDENTKLKRKVQALNEEIRRQKPLEEAEEVVSLITAFDKEIQACRQLTDQELQTSVHVDDTDTQTSFRQVQFKSRDFKADLLESVSMPIIPQVLKREKNPGPSRIGSGVTMELRSDEEPSIFDEQSPERRAICREERVLMAELDARTRDLQTVNQAVLKAKQPASSRSSNQGSQRALSKFQTKSAK